MTPEQLEQERKIAELLRQYQAMGVPRPPQHLIDDILRPPPTPPNKPDSEGMEQARDLTKEHHISWLERIRHPFRERRARQEEKEKADKIRKEEMQNSSYAAEEIERIQRMAERDRMLHEAYNQDHGESHGRGYGMGR